MQSLQPLARDMCVDLRRRDVGMTEQQLHDAQVGAMIQKMRRECMTQRMRRQRFGSNARDDRIAFQRVPQRLSRWPRMTCCEEQSVAAAVAGERRPRFSQIANNPSDRVVAAGGKIGGFMGRIEGDSLAIKRWLLTHEGVL